MSVQRPDLLQEAHDNAARYPIDDLRIRSTLFLNYVSSLHLHAGLVAGYADRLDMFTLPFDVLAMAWHPHNHTEPGLEWLRALTARAAGL